jgi:phage tail-like protein
MENDQSDNLLAFYFKITYKGSEVAFKEVSGISNQLNLPEVAEGGENRFKYRLPTAAKFQNLVLKRGFVAKDSIFLNWCGNTIGGTLASAIEPSDVCISLMDATGEIILAWKFKQAYPVKLEIENLKLDVNFVAIESVELAYAYFEIIKGNSIS